MKTVEIGPKGRVVIPKDVREQSGISVPGELIVSVDGTGRITLQPNQFEKSAPDRAEEITNLERE